MVSQENIKLTNYDNILEGKFSSDAEHILIELSADVPFNVLLPDLRNSYDKEFMFKNTGSAIVTIKTKNGQQIDTIGNFSHTVNNGDYVSFRSNYIDKWILLDVNK